MPQLSEAELNITQSVGNTGNVCLNLFHFPARADSLWYGQMFEKFNLLARDAAGAGGEYTVQTGFGWTSAPLSLIEQLR